MTKAMILKWFLAASGCMLLTAVSLWAHCVKEKTASPSVVCVGQDVTLTETGFDCDQVVFTNITVQSNPSAGVFTNCPSCGPCEGMTNCAVWTVVSVSLRSVTFSGGTSAFREILQDHGTATFASPHWTSTNQSPVAYVRNNPLTVSAVFAIEPANYAGGVVVRGTAANGLIFSNAAGGVSGGLITLPATASSASLANQVDYLPALAVNWEYSVDGGASFCNAGASTHPIYVTWQPPAQTTPTHTLLDVGCRAAQGEAGVPGTDDDKVLDKVWAKFQTKAIRRASDNVLLSYYGFFDVNSNGAWDAGTDIDFNSRDPNAPNFCPVTSAADLIRIGNGQCGAWAEFLNEVLKAQGLAAINGAANKLINIRPVAQNQRLPAQNWKTKGNPDWKIVNDYAGITGANAVNPGNKQAADAVGKAGQGNSPNPPAWFERHYGVQANGAIYDPSYAVGPFADRKDHELTTFAGRIFPQGNHRRLEPLPPSDGNPANDGDLMHIYQEVNFP